MLRRRIRSLLSVLVLVSVGALSACGGDDPTGPGNVGSGPVSALIDGVQWTAVLATGTNTSGIVAVGASDAAGAGIGFAFEGSAAGTYVFGTGAVHNANYTAGGSTWIAGSLIGSGSIVVTTVTATRVVGTFAFEGVSITGGSPATRSITQGMFDVTF